MGCLKKVLPFLPIPVPIAIATGQVPGLPGVVHRAATPPRPTPGPQPNRTTIVVPPPRVTTGPKITGPKVPPAAPAPPPARGPDDGSSAGPGTDMTRGLLVTKRRRGGGTLLT